MAVKTFVKRIPTVSWFLEGEKQEEALKRPLVEIMNGLSRKTELGVNFEVTYNDNHGGEVDSQLDRRINIYVFGTPFSGTGSMTLEKVKIKGVEIPLKEGQQDCLNLSEKLTDLSLTYLKPIYDENKVVIGLVENNNVFIPFDLFHNIETYNTDGKNAMKIVEFVVEEATKHIITDKKKIEDKIENMPVLEFIKGIIENCGKFVEKKKKEKESVEKSLETIIRNMVVEERRLMEISHFLEFALSEKDEASLMKKNKNAIQGLLRAGYTSIKWTGNTLKAKTKPIPIMFKGKEFVLGGYEITITTEGAVKIINKKNKVDGHDHPHISNGNPCWGNLGKSVSKLIAQFEFVPILDIILTYLTSYNPKDAYRKLGFWDKDGGERCEDCGETLDTCECS